MEQNSRLFNSVSSNSITMIILITVVDDIGGELRNHLYSDEARGVVIPGGPEIITQVLLGILLQCGRMWMLSKHNIAKQEMVYKVSEVIDTLFKN